MARKRVDINPAWGENLRKICKDQGITQVELGKKIGLTQQTISKIAQGHASLTTQTANAIVKLFPQYRFQWLMGYDRYATEGEYIANRIMDRAFEEMNEIDAVMPLFDLYGYEEVSRKRGKDRSQVLITVRKAETSYVVEHNDLADAFHDIAWYASARLQRLFDEQGREENG